MIFTAWVLCRRLENTNNDIKMRARGTACERRILMAACEPAYPPARALGWGHKFLFMHRPPDSGIANAGAAADLADSHNTHAPSCYQPQSPKQQTSHALPASSTVGPPPQRASQIVSH